MGRKIKDIIGQRFGKLIAIKMVDERVNSGLVAWVCQCDCGNKTTVNGANLRNGKTKSCGCLHGSNIRDLTGKRFGKLVVIEPTAERVRANVVFKCICDCGNFAYIPGNNLVQNLTKSCGCLRKETMRAKKGPLHPCWDSEKTDEEREDTRMYPKYKEWRLEVYQRDGFTCQKCGKVGGVLNAHHIEGYANNPELRTELSNGITLCKDCHGDYHHLHGYKNATREMFEKWMIGE